MYREADTFCATECLIWKFPVLIKALFYSVHVQRQGTGLPSGVARVSSARGPMLASPPPPELAPPLPHRPTRLAPSGLGVRPPPPRLVNPASATVLCNEVTLLICLGLILQLGPTSWAGAPPRLAPGGHAPPAPPPPRHAWVFHICHSAFCRHHSWLTI